MGKGSPRAISVLVLFERPEPLRSRANVALRAALANTAGIAVHDLYETYPDMILDVGAEQARLSAASGLVIQHPFYWYSVPAIVKEWLDLVLTHGFAYGEKARALSGKPWLQAITLGGPATDYTDVGRRVDDFLTPFEATADLCGATRQAPFLVHGARIIDTVDLTKAAHDYRARVIALRDAGAQGAGSE
jgi:glutathione-regulated potassium-efflux system ancillary protein KefG